MLNQGKKEQRENKKQADDRTLTKRGKYYALLAAVGNYCGMQAPDLVTYKTDIALIHSGLTRGLKFENENIRVLGEDGYITAKVMANAIAEFSQALGAEDTFVLYFSGHGRNRALLFSDMGIEIQSLLSVVDQMSAKNKIVILDCCYSGDFHMDGAQKLSLEDEIRDFAGHGTAVFASSAADEVSRISAGEKYHDIADCAANSAKSDDVISYLRHGKRAGNVSNGMRENEGRANINVYELELCGRHSIYTGFLSAAMMSPRIIRKGQISLQNIQKETSRLMQAWNETHPAQHQQPIFRSCMGGTVYFQVEEYHPYIPQDVYYETDRYIVCSVKPLSTAGIKRLAAFVILKESTTQHLPELTKEIAAHIRYAEVYASEKSERHYGKASARAIWCYFGQDWSDIAKHLYFAYTVWAADEETQSLYYKANGKHSYITDGICVFENNSYEMLREMQQSTRSREEFINETQKLLSGIINLAEEFIVAMQEIANKIRTVESVKEEYAGWVKDVKRQYLRLTDGDVPPDDLRAWTDEVEELAGNVLDLAILLEQTSERSFGEREEWLMEQAIKGYQRSLEELAKRKENFYVQVFIN